MKNVRVVYTGFGTFNAFIALKRNNSTFEHNRKGYLRTHIQTDLNQSIQNKATNSSNMLAITR